MLQSTSILESVKWNLFGNLLSLSLGAFVRDQDVISISNSCHKITKVSLYSQNITDFGMASLIQRNPDLHKINISECLKVYGECFEELHPSKKLSLKVFFDEYKLKNLRLILQ